VYLQDLRQLCMGNKQSYLWMLKVFSSKIIAAMPRL